MFKNLIPKIFYARMQDGLDFFVGGLGFQVLYQDATMAVIARDGAKAYLVENAEWAAAGTGHRNRPSVALKPWGARVRDAGPHHGLRGVSRVAGAGVSDGEPGRAVDGHAQETGSAGKALPALRPAGARSGRRGKRVRAPRRARSRLMEVRQASCTMRRRSWPCSPRCATSPGTCAAPATACATWRSMTPATASPSPPISVR
ncbi:hypothetical protein NB693_20735 [Pantoea ananatis]|nr:hypothetical protein [Pantoea ananatis]